MDRMLICFYSCKKIDLHAKFYLLSFILRKIPENEKEQQPSMPQGTKKAKHLFNMISENTN